MVLTGKNTFCLTCDIVLCVVSRSNVI